MKNKQKPDIVIVQYYKSLIDGVMTSSIDLYFNLRDYFNVEFIIICPELFYLKHKGKSFNDFYDKHLNDTEFLRNGKHIEFEEFNKDETNEVTSSIPFLKMNKNFGDPKLYHSIVCVDNNISVGSKITICSARVLYEKLLGRLNLTFRMAKGNLFILDSLDLYKSKVKAIPNLNIAVPKNLNKCLYFSNPANFLSRKNNIEYYHKLNKKRLDTLDLDDYNYKRCKEKTKVKGHYFENIGKGIFEHLYHEKKVNYYSENMTIKDGLYYYLKQFGVDATKDHLPLKISKEEIEDKLFMKEDDPIIREIEKIL